MALKDRPVLGGPITPVMIETGYYWQAVTIPAGASISLAVDIGDGRMATHLILPDGFEGNAIQFKVSHEGATFVDLYDKTGTIVKPTAGASRAIVLPDGLVGIRHFSIVAYTTAAVQVQAAARTLFVLTASV